MDPADLERAVDEAITEAGATSAKDLGRVMKGVMVDCGPERRRRMVSELVQEKARSG